jgi:hypothetical protein
LIFLDPDNGFETLTQTREKWVRHSEVDWILRSMPDSSAVVVYQHRPQRRPWRQVFQELQERIGYAKWAAAAYEANLAFVVLGKAAVTGHRLVQAMARYSDGHATVHVTELATAGA